MQIHNPIEMSQAIISDRPVHTGGGGSFMKNGYAMARVMEGKVFQLTPFFQCKDYMNEMLYNWTLKSSKAGWPGADGIEQVLSNEMLMVYSGMDAMRVLSKVNWLLIKLELPPLVLRPVCWGVDNAMKTIMGDITMDKREIAYVEVPPFYFQNTFRMAFMTATCRMAQVPRFSDSYMRTVMNIHTSSYQRLWHTLVFGRDTSEKSYWEVFGKDLLLIENSNPFGMSDIRWEGIQESCHSVHGAGLVSALQPFFDSLSAGVDTIRVGSDYYSYSIEQKEFLKKVLRKHYNITDEE